MARNLLFGSTRIFVVLACFIVPGCGDAKQGKVKESPRVTVAHPVVRSLMDEDDYNGWLEAYKTVDVRARVRGHITKVHFQDGDLVTEGKTPLFDLDEAPFKAELAQTEAQARALESQEVSARKDLERNRLLNTEKAVSQKDLDTSEADAKSFEAQIMAKKAEADRIRLDLKYAKIIAPLTGKVGKANLVEGSLVNAGGTDPVLTTIVAVDPIYVDFNVDERAMQRYQESRLPTGRTRQALREQKIPFNFGLDTEKGFPHEGRLVFADNKYAEGTGTILVRGEAKNPDGQLIPGSRVRVRVPVSDKYEAAVVPDTAVLSDQDRKYLLVLGKDNMVLRRDITPGRLLDDGMRVVLPAPGEEKAAGNKDWIKNWERQWVITVGLQRARVNYPSSRWTPTASRSTPRLPRSKTIHETTRGSLMFARFFVDRPIFATVLSLVIVIVGLVALTRLPIAQYPEVAPPTIQVSATYPGADAETVATTVATPIEQEVNGVERMLYMASRCTNDGQMFLDVTFELGTDLDTAQVLVQNRVSVAEAKLPEDVKRIGVTTKKKSPSILLCVNLVSDKKPDGSFYYDQLYLSNYASLSVKDDLARVKGVGDVTFLGPRDYSMRVWLDPQKLASLGMTAADVIKAIREQNVQVAAGRLGQPPVAAGAAVPFQLVIKTQGRLSSEQQFDNIIVKTGIEGRSRQAARRRAQGPARRARPDRREGHGAGGQELRRQQLPRRRSVGHAGRVPVARLERLEDRRRNQGEDEGAEGQVSPGRGLQDRLRHDGVHRRIGPRGLQDPLRGVRSGLHRRARLPAGLAGDAHAHDRRAGVADRHVRRDGPAWASR